ncbi:MAG: hypothetical protein JW836_05165 [Deltaproteobacteria bacterium]|nr:hypothetical protein [Deltaproteobacteria bacterium]
MVGLSPVVNRDLETLDALKRTSSDGVASPYPQRNLWKAKIRQENGLIEKDYRDAPLPFRLYGEISLHWEAEALKRLKGIEGIPVYLGRPKSHLLRMTRVPGVPLDKLRTTEVSKLCFSRLRGLLHQIHSRGVAHGDLHMRNILIDAENPYIVDFSTAYVRGRLPLLDKNFFRFFELLDLERLYKTELKFFGSGKPPRMFYLYRLVKGIK